MSADNADPGIRPADEIQLPPEAEKLVEEEAARFLTSHILGAKFLAYSQRNEMVLKQHVHETIRIIRSAPRRAWGKEFVIILGGAFLGAFVPGLITELGAAVVKPLNVLLYTGLGFLGVLGIVWGLWSSR
jgi:hypothetical protein